MGKFFKAFKNFLLEGNALSMAVGVIIGAAMKDLVTSLVDNVFAPIIGLVLGQVDFSTLSFGIGDAQIKYGAFITSIINFVLLAFVVFLVIYLIDIIKEKIKKMTTKGEEIVEEPTTKVCPFCQSEVNINAVKCPHCTSSLEK